MGRNCCVWSKHAIISVSISDENAKELVRRFDKCAVTVLWVVVPYRCEWTGLISMDWDFMRCIYYPLADEEPKNHKLQFSDYIHLMPPYKKDWILDLHNYMTENNC